MNVIRRFDVVVMLAAVMLGTMALAMAALYTLNLGACERQAGGRGFVWHYSLATDCQVRHPDTGVLTPFKTYTYGEGVA